MTCPLCKESGHRLSQCKRWRTKTAAGALNACTTVAAPVTTPAEPLATEPKGQSQSAQTWPACGSDAPDSEGGEV